MKINKKFLFTFFSLIFILMLILGVQEVSATGEVITYNGITTALPEVSEYNELEDPEAPKSNKLKSNLSFVEPVGTTWGMQISVSDLISKYESEDAYVGIDVSKWQGNIDWEQVKKSGVKYVMIRCGYRGYGSSGAIVKDPYFDTYIKGALDNGLYVGVYFFSAAITEAEAIEEAAYVLKWCEDYKITYPIVYDFEYFGNLFDAESGNPYRTNGLTNEQINKNAKAFLGYIKNHSEYKPMLYGSTHYLQTIWNISDYDIWLAHYPSLITSNKTTYNGNYEMWQCTDNGIVPGINTVVDMNFDYKYYSFLTNKTIFLDVNESMWFYEAVKYCKENEIILGYGETREYFKPNEKMTRGMFVTILYRMAGNPEFDETLAKYFPDVNQDWYYAKAIKWASAVGVVNGYDDGNFGPDNSIMRQDLAIMLRNYVRVILNEDVSTVDENRLINFKDYYIVDEYALESVIWAVENKVINGTNEGYIQPWGLATRAETAVMICNYMKNH